jgi:Leucine-rich repeat (LRR) protein
MAEPPESGTAEGRRVRLWRLIPESLLVLLLLVWLVLGILPNSANRQKQAVKAIERNRGQIGYYCQRILQPDGSPSYRFQKEPPGTTLFHRIVGKHYFMTAAWIRVGTNEENCVARLADLPNIEAAIFDGAFESDLEHVKHLRKLRYLSLKTVTVSDADHSPYLVFEHLPNLEVLDLGDAQFGDGDAKYLQHAVNLRSLILSDTMIGDEGVAFVQNLNSLEFLDLRSTKVTDQGITYLSKLPRLKTLGLDLTDVSDASTDSFSKMTSLRELRLYKTNVQEINRLRRALPKCRIVYFKRQPADC